MVKLLQECEAAQPLVQICAYFVDEKSTQVLGFWATKDGVQVHFSSAEQVRQQMATDTFCDTTLFYPQTDTGEQSISYLMLECKKCGLAPVCHTPAGEDPVARFSYFDCEGQHKEKTICITKNFSDTRPRMIPLGEESLRMSTVSTNLKECWGLVVENSAGGFLSDGCYTVSSTACLPSGTEHVSISFEMDFINVSRCILVEGSEVWITVTGAVYDMILQQVKQQGLDIMLPVSQELHAHMEGARVVRAFYVLGGSVHDQGIESNTVRLVCIIANKKSNPGKKTTQDDQPDMDSIVNQQLDQHNTRMIAISLPIINKDGTAVVSFHRDESLPVYLYFKERSLARA